MTKIAPKKIKKINNSFIGGTQTMENSMGSPNYVKSCANDKLNSEKFKN